MKASQYFTHIAISLVLALALAFSGCDSTSSDSNDDEEESSSVFFNSEEIAPGETFSYTFEEEANVEYFCEIHAPNMQGEIIVTSSEEAVEQDTVIMNNNQFHPQELSIAPNTEVVWINNEDHAHDIKSGNPSSDDAGGY